MESNHAWAKRCALYPCRARHPRLARRSSQTASTSKYSIKLLTETLTKNYHESGDAWSRTTLALISYAFCALSVPRSASPFVKAIFTDSLNLSIFNLKKTLSENRLRKRGCVESNHACPNFLRFLRSIRAALGIPVCQGDLHRQPQHSLNINMVKVLKMKKSFLSHAWDLRVLSKQNKKSYM